LKERIIMNSELENTWRGVVVTYNKVIHQHFFWKTMTIFNQDSWSPNQESNLAPPEHEAGVQSTQPLYLVNS
jgi:hypothetical protein